MLLQNAQIVHVESWYRYLLAVTMHRSNNKSSDKRKKNMRSENGFEIKIFVIKRKRANAERNKKNPHNMWRASQASERICVRVCNGRWAMGMQNWLTDAMMMMTMMTHCIVVDCMCVQQVDESFHRIKCNYNETMRNTNLDSCSNDDEKKVL